MKPYVLLNAAMTVDGKIATSNSSLKISNEKDLIRVHQLRSIYDAIMVGINTVIVDNPKLTVHKIPAEKSDNPIRIIIDSKARTPLDALAIDDSSKSIVIVSEAAPSEKITKLSEKCEVIICGEQHVDLTLAMDKLYQKGIESVMLEGGATLNFSMFKEKLIDEVSICIGPKILGGVKSKTLVDGFGFEKEDIVNLCLKKVYTLEDNVIIEYEVKY